MSRKLQIVVEEVPDNVHEIATRRCGDLIRYSLNCAALGDLNLRRLAASAYLQGFADAYDGLTRSPAPPQAAESKGEK
jgi:hypothetical protein